MTIATTSLDAESGQPATRYPLRSSAASKRWQGVVVTGLVLCSLVSLATTVGMLAFFLPAGLGAREGVLVAYLVGLDLSLEAATTVAVMNDQ